MSVSQEKLTAYTTYPVLDDLDIPHRVRIVPKSEQHTADTLGIYGHPSIFYSVQKALLHPSEVQADKVEGLPWKSVKYYFIDFLITLAQEGVSLPQEADDVLAGLTEFLDIMAVVVRYPWETKTNTLCSQTKTTGYTATYFLLYESLSL